MYFDDEELISRSDVTIGNRSMDSVRIYRDIQGKINDLMYQRELMWKEFVKQMSDAYSRNLPSELSYEFVKKLSECKKEEKIDELAWREQLLLERVFTEEFLKRHKIVINDITFLGWEQSETYLRFIVDKKDVFQVTIPNPIRYKGKEGEYSIERFVMRAHQLKGGVAALTAWGKAYEFIDDKSCETYDWKEPFAAIEQHYKKRK